MQAAQTVALITPDGVRINAKYWYGAGPVAYVVAHGFTGSATAPRVRSICQQLAATGATVLAPDFRGHGRSGGRSTLGELEVHDVAAAVAYLRAAGHAAIAILGWSMGGSVALRFAGLGGDVDAVVSISSPGHWWERGTAPMRLVHWAAETRTGRAATRLVMRTRLIAGWAQMPESPVELVARIAPRPLLIVHGDADRYFPVHHGQILAVAAGAGDPGGTAEFWLEAGMGHAESGTTPELVARIDAWVRIALGSPAARRLRP